MNTQTYVIAAALTLLVPIGASAQTNQELAERIAQLEKQLKALQAQASGSNAPANTVTSAAPEQPQTTANQTPAQFALGSSSRFNPEIGVVLNARYSDYSLGASEPEGYPFGHEGERGDEGFSAGHTEVRLSGNVDNRFYGNLSVAIAEHGHGHGHDHEAEEEGEEHEHQGSEREVEVELEEAYLETLPGAGLPTGLSLKAGRALWQLGYLNPQHTHADDFADRPLPYRAFLDGAYNDDGVQLTYLLPLDQYVEVGGGVFAGNDYPFADSSSSKPAWSAFARTGADLGASTSFTTGVSYLSGNANERATNEDELHFTGESDLAAIDAKLVFAPQQNNRYSELSLQGEYFIKQEDGLFETHEAEADQKRTTDGWYAQAVYRFHPNWRLGARYSELSARDDLIGESVDDYRSVSLMTDWSGSEYSRLRLQYNQEELPSGATDDQVVLQYIMSLGAHPAHSF